MARARSQRKKLLEELKQLSEDRIRALADYASYLREREEWETTAEILGETETVRQLRQSRKAWAEGRRDEFVSLDELKARLNA